MAGGITDVRGVRVGHAHDIDALTGCTALLFERSARVGIFTVGMASGTRACDVGRAGHLNDEIHAVVLAGGSNYGLDAAGGAMRFLEEQHIGYDVGTAVVPIVPSAILFDLGLGDPTVRPDVDMGYRACERATDGPLAEGCVGAGTGATVGKLFGMARAMKSGLGTANVESPYGPVGALSVVNAFGDVVDPQTGGLLAGLRDESGARLVSTVEQMRLGNIRSRFGPPPSPQGGTHTTLAVVAVEIELTKPDLNRLARLADQAVVRTHAPAHTTFDGDVIFAVSTRRRRGGCDLNHLALFAQAALEEAIVRAVTCAEGLGGLPAHRDLFRS
jgi:L-aminopeptidase/D-esterase-like protein